MYELLAMFQSTFPNLPANYDTLGLLLYMLYNETRHRRNGHGGITLALKDTADKLSLLALQGAGVLVRVDAHEKRLGDMEHAFNDYRREIRIELKEQSAKVYQLEGRLESVGK